MDGGEHCAADEQLDGGGQVEVVERGEQVEVYFEVVEDVRVHAQQPDLQDQV